MTSQTTITEVIRSANGDVLRYACGHSKRFVGSGEHGAGYFIQVGHRVGCLECATPTYCAVKGVCHLAQA